MVVAISLEAHEVVSVEADAANDKSKRTGRRYVTDDPVWFDGPPCGIVEHVIDEDGLEACSLSPEADES